MTKRHVIEILYAKRCRFLPLAVERVRHALSLRDDHLDVEVRLILVDSFVDAVARDFRGSPTVRIDHRDVETRAGSVAPAGLPGRAYEVESRIERAPSVASIRRALDQLVAAERARARVAYARPRTRTEPPAAVDVVSA